MNLSLNLPGDQSHNSYDQNFYQNWPTASPTPFNHQQQINNANIQPQQSPIQNNLFMRQHSPDKNNVRKILKGNESPFENTKKEFNIFKLTNDETKVSKEDFFDLSSDTNSEQYLYNESSYTPTFADSSKSYFKTLYSLPIPAVVKRKVEEDIIASKKRIHSIPPEVMCSLVINAYECVGLEIEFFKIFEMFGIDEKKSKVIELLSKVSTKKTLASGQENSFAMIIVEPSKCVAEVFNSYLMKIQYTFDNNELVIQNIKRIMMKLEEIYPPLVQKPPRECASILIYLYLKGNLEFGNRRIFNKKIFSELPGITSTKFDAYFDDIERKFYDLFRNMPDFMATCYPRV